VYHKYLSTADGWDLPALQSEQEFAVAVLYLPALQVEQPLAPAALHVPALQVPQTMLATVFLNRPALHSVHVCVLKYRLLPTTTLQPRLHMHVFSPVVTTYASDHLLPLVCPHQPQRAAVP
jgi:hypothetical protein